GELPPRYLVSFPTRRSSDLNLRPLFVGAIISELNMARLLDEEIDGLLEDSFVGAAILRRKGLDKYIQAHNISLGSSDVYVMFSQDRKSTRLNSSHVKSSYAV